MTKLPLLLCGAALLAATFAPVADAQVQPGTNTFPANIPVTRAVPDPQDTPYPGTITVDIDATDIVSGAERITETVPVAPGTHQLALLLPEWIPGHHSRGGLPAELNAVHFTADGKDLTWHRDPIDTYAYVIDVPEGAQAVVARMIHTPAVKQEPGDRVTVTREIINLEWNEMVLYPAGH